MKKTRTTRTLAQWTALAERRLRSVLRLAQSMRGLGGPRGEWTVELRLVGGATMVRINGKHRGKPYATDVLSFPAPAIFQAGGFLGELVVCVPTLVRQAKEQGHRAELELEVLLVHGVLHLLGMDHERGGKQAAKMALWERRLLRAGAGGLISRTAHPVAEAAPASTYRRR